MDAPFRFRSLGSGSSGNATLIELGGQRPQRLLVDAGFSSVKKLEQRLHSASGLMPDAVDAIFITHEHSDHVGCALKLAEKYDLDVKQIVLEKMKKNALKYPIEKAKGNPKKYTEL